MSRREVSNSTTPMAERRPLMLALRVPRSYGSVFPYYKFVRDAANESFHNEVHNILYYQIPSFTFREPNFTK